MSVTFWICDSRHQSFPVHDSHLKTPGQEEILTFGFSLAGCFDSLPQPFSAFYLNAPAGLSCTAVCSRSGAYRFSLSVNDAADGLRTSVIPGGNLDSALCAGRMDNLPIADIHGNVVDRTAAVCIEDQIPWPHLG